MHILVVSTRFNGKVSVQSNMTDLHFISGIAANCIKGGVEVAFQSNISNIKRKTILE